MRVARANPLGAVSNLLGKVRIMCALCTPGTQLTHDTVTSSVSARQLRAELSSIVGRVAFGHERIGLTRNGKLAAVVIGVDDLELLEQLEDAQDLAAYRSAKAEDDGTRVSLSDLRDELGS